MEEDDKTGKKIRRMESLHKSKSIIPCVDTLKHVLSFRSSLWTGVQGCVVALANLFYPETEISHIRFMSVRLIKFFDLGLG